MRYITHSVFTKLIVVLAVAGVLINLAVFGFLASAFHKIDKNPFGHDLVHYAKHLANKIGVPPDLDEARKIANQSLFQIIYQGPDSNWSTLNKNFPMHLIKFRPFREYHGIEIGSFRKYHAFKLKHGMGNLVFISSFLFAREQVGGALFIFLLLILTSIVALTWIILRNILKPLKWLSTGVEQVSIGNLEHRVPELRKDELGDLASAFNTMNAHSQKKASS
jgi:methyl-accepting chemotaxis protein